MKKTLSIILAVMMIFSSFAVVTAFAGKSIDLSFDAPQVGKRTPPIGKMTITNGTVEDVTVVWYKVKADDTMEALGSITGTFEEGYDYLLEIIVADGVSAVTVNGKKTTAQNGAFYCLYEKADILPSDGSENQPSLFERIIAIFQQIMAAIMNIIASFTGSVAA